MNNASKRFLAFAGAAAVGTAACHFLTKEKPAALNAPAVDGYASNSEGVAVSSPKEYTQKRKQDLKSP